MSDVPHIGEAASRPNFTPERLRMLEREGRFSRPRRDLNGRIYSELNLARPPAVGMGWHPRWLESFEELPGATP